MGHYIGLDVGEHRLFAAVIENAPETAGITFCPTTEIDKVITWCAATKAKGVAVDAPSAHSRGLASVGSRRVAEEILGIGGCYGTPTACCQLPGWMATGMECHRRLSAAFGETLDLAGTGLVFEVHPTYGFRSMLGVTENAGRIICGPEHLLRPKNPRRSIGHLQRVEMLRLLLGNFGIAWTPALATVLVSRVDWTDAAVSAVLAVFRSEGKVRPIGDPSEGTITIVDPAMLGDLSATLKEAISAIAPQRQLKPLRLRHTDDDADYVVLRLGARGLGSLSEAETLEAVRGQMTEGLIVLPVGLRAIGVRWIERAATGGFWLLLARNGRIAIALHVIEVIGKGRDAPTPKEDVLGDNRDPWPGVTASDYWLGCNAFVDDIDLPMTRLLTRQRGEWIAGAPGNQTAWLGARIGDESLVQRFRVQVDDPRPR